MSFSISQVGSVLFCSWECSYVHLSCRSRLALNSQFSRLSLLRAWITGVGQNIQFDPVFFIKYYILIACVYVYVYMNVGSQGGQKQLVPLELIIDSCEPPNVGAGN